MCAGVQGVGAEAVAAFHEHVEVGAGGGDFDPAGVVAGRGRGDGADEGEVARLHVLGERKASVSEHGEFGGKGDGYFCVTPNLICPHIRRVQVLLGSVKHHSMHSRLLVKRRVLHVLVERAGGADAEDVDEARMVIERIAVHIVRRFCGGEDEDGAGLRVGVVCSGWEGVSPWGARRRQT